MATCRQDEWFILLLLRHPTHAVWDSWEVPLSWPMSREMRIGTIVLPMDALCIIVLPMLG